jgi:hypothetical protein
VLLCSEGDGRSILLVSLSECHAGRSLFLFHIFSNAHCFSAKKKMLTVFLVAQRSNGRLQIVCQYSILELLALQDIYDLYVLL